jgi:phage tail sheath gpL-like
MNKKKIAGLFAKFVKVMEDHDEALSYIETLAAITHLHVVTVRFMAEKFPEKDRLAYIRKHVKTFKELVENELS